LGRNMTDYNFAGLSPRSFEHLVQALAVRILGPGLTVFGDGPDGGREATFQGRMTFPSLSASWDGYCVIQAKFLQRPMGTTHDGQWLLEQVKNELDAYVNPGTKRTPPEYYIVASNVVLGPAAHAGGKDKLAALFASYGNRLPLRGWAAWDYDQLRTYVDGHRDVRLAYAGWITPGDVLAEVAASITSLRPDFDSTMALFLAKEFLGDQYTNLTQATQSADDRIPISQVFVDLPVLDERNGPRVLGRPTTSQFLTGVVDAAREKFEHGRERVITGRQWEHLSEAEPGRVVLVGGPGQGKTTLSQFVCQLFRASLLSSRSSLPREVRTALSHLIAECESQQLSLPAARRFPVRVVLNSFAAWLDRQPAQQHHVSLLTYLAQLVQRRTDRTLSPEDLRNWLAAYPWIIVLDGLDEVPPSSNRQAVLTAIEEFWVDVAHVNADVLVIATTRPQGYTSEFSPQLYHHKYLCPLSPEQALAYAQRLVAAKYSTNQDRRDAVYGRLQQACRMEQTAKLMTSPLQVAIMATLVDEAGSPPQHRWGLFHEYYETIIRREREREIPAAQLLRSYRNEIDTIHYRVALALQIAGERGGNTDPKLSHAAFAAIIDDRLMEEGHDDDSRQTLREQIIYAAAQRLVFLVGVEAGSVGFEIRSLQEFMAAEAIMQGPEAAIRSRLRQIAPIQNWRNVFLFAAGRCFAVAQHLRDSIYTICRELNLDAVGQKTRIGGALAIDLLEDAVAITQPRHVQLLTECALEVLDTPPSNIHARLAAIYDPRCRHLFQERIAVRLARGFSDAAAAWTCVLDLGARSVDWARALVDAHWPEDSVRQIRLLQCATPPAFWSDWLAPRADGALRRLPPWEFRSLLGIIRPARDESPDRSRSPTRWASLVRGWRDEHTRLIVRIALSAGSSAARFGACEGLRSAPPLEDHHAAWEPVIQAERFAREPSSLSLADALEALAQLEPYAREWQRHSLPWPIAACIGASASSTDILSYATAARDGRFGSSREWLAAEARWVRDGLTERDLIATSQWPLPLDHSIGEVGCPIYAASHHLIHRVEAGDGDSEWVYRALERFYFHPLIREALANWTMSLLEQPFTEAPAWLTPEKAARLVKASPTLSPNAELVLSLNNAGRLSEEWIQFFDEHPPKMCWSAPSREEVAAFVATRRDATRRRGLLRALALFAADAPLDLTDIIIGADQVTSKDCADALLLTIARGALEDPDRYGVLAASCGQQSLFFTHSLASAIAQQASIDETVARCLVTMLDHIESRAVRKRGIIVGTLTGMRDRMSSRLAMSDVWSDLAFPSGLRSIIEQVCQLEATPGPSSERPV
jgi:hypothetical protein